MEVWSQCFNRRHVNIPLGLEGQYTSGFLEKLLLRVLKLGLLTAEKVHKLGVQLSIGIVEKS